MAASRRGRSLAQAANGGAQAHSGIPAWQRGDASQSVSTFSQSGPRRHTVRGCRVPKRPVEILWQAGHATRPGGGEYSLNCYLLALNTAAGRIGTFALSRCRSLAGIGQHFARPAGFSAPAFFKDAFGISQADKPWKVRLLFASEVATYIRERVWHASQALRQRRDGALEFRLQTSSRKELTRWILSWMPHVKVLAPRQLRDRVRQRMRQGLARCFSVSGHASQKRMRALRCGSLSAVRS